MNEEMNAGLFLSLLTPRSFLMLILSVSSSPGLVVLLFLWVGQKSVLFGKTELDKEKRVLDRNNGQQRP